jgi:tetratricopeptide (TPR) repeat protein
MAPRAPRPAFAAMVLLTVLAPATSGSAHQPETAADIRLHAESLAYDLDHAEALALLRRSIAMAPGDPAGYRALASVLWLNLLFQRGAVTVDHYLGSFSRSSVDLKQPPAEINAEFHSSITRAIELAQQRVNARPADPQAHFDLGAAIGLQSSYTATVEGRMMSGFKAARRAYDEHERVLALDPSRKDAGLVVGTYRYIVSTLSLPMRLMAYAAGFGGGRDRGIGMVEAAAAQPFENRVDALFALVLMYNRERRFDEALNVLEELRRLHPRNRLIVLEAGSTALRAGRAAQADTLLTEGLTMLAADKRVRMPGEEALWRYKRGAARVAQGRFDTAADDLRLALAPESAKWVQGRTRVELARVAMAKGDKGGAVDQARQGETLCEQGNDPVCVEGARTMARAAGGR